MIYCVIPPALADDLYERMVEYYEDDPNVEVIIDRRGNGDSATHSSDRRRRRVPGTFPKIEARK